MEDRSKDLAYLQFDSWSKTYTNLMLADFLQNQTEDKLWHYWCKAIEADVILDCHGASQA